MFHANHGSDPTTNLGRFRDAKHIPAVHLGLAPLKTAPASRPHSPARCMSNASPALCHGLDVIFKAHHAKHGRDPTATLRATQGRRARSCCSFGASPHPGCASGCKKWEVERQARFLAFENRSAPTSTESDSGKSKIRSREVHMQFGDSRRGSWKPAPR